YYVRGNLTHRINFQAILALMQPVAPHSVDDADTFIDGPAKRNHHLHIRQAHLFTNASQRQAFQCKASRISDVVIPRRAAKPDHWVFFLGFKFGSAKKTRIFICLEVTKPDNYGPWKERSGNPSYTLA